MLVSDRAGRPLITPGLRGTDVGHDVGEERERHDEPAEPGLGVFVGPDGVRGRALSSWVDRGLAFVSTLPWKTSATKRMTRR